MRCNEPKEKESAQDACEIDESTSTPPTPSFKQVQQLEEASVETDNFQYPEFPSFDQTASSPTPTPQSRFSKSRSGADRILTKAMKELEATTNATHDIVLQIHEFIKNQEPFNSSNQSLIFAPTSNSTAITDYGTVSESFSHKFHADLLQASSTRDVQKIEDYICKIIPIAKTNNTIALTRKIVKIRVEGGVLYCEVCNSVLKKPSDIASKLAKTDGEKTRKISSMCFSKDANNEYEIPCMWRLCVQIGTRWFYCFAVPFESQGLQLNSYMHRSDCGDNTVLSAIPCHQPYQNNPIVEHEVVDHPIQSSPINLPSNAAMSPVKSAPTTPISPVYSAPTTRVVPETPTKRPLPETPAVRSSIAC